VSDAVRSGRWRTVERIVWAAGLLAVAVWSIAYIAGIAGARRGLARFNAVRAEQAAAPATSAILASLSQPDQRLWSPVRRRAWKDSEAGNAAVPVAVLRIRRIGLEVPVLEGTDDWTLNHGAGHIEDTAPPGADGNTGIAAHRDGFFRVLKDVMPGDALEIQTLKRTLAYRIERTWIVEPDDVTVLDPTPSPSVTLVTCYPFYFIGSAPQRFIVRAVGAADTARP
jgi:sortase A